VKPIPVTPRDSFAAKWWTTGTGCIELAILPWHAGKGYHPGQCDDGIHHLRTLPYIHRQLKKIDAEILRKVLSECAAWSEEELQDHDANLSRILWLACADIVEEDYK